MHGGRTRKEARAAEREQRQQTGGTTEGTTLVVVPLVEVVVGGAEPKASGPPPEPPRNSAAPALQVDGPTQKQEWNSPKHLRHFSVLRKMDNNPWPIGFQTKVAAANESPVGRRNSQGGPMLSIQNG